MVVAAAAAVANAGLARWRRRAVCGLAHGARERWRLDLAPVCSTASRSEDSVSFYSGSELLVARPKIAFRWTSAGVILRRPSPSIQCRVFLTLHGGDRSGEQREAARIMQGRRRWPLMGSWNAVAAAWRRCSALVSSFTRPT